MQCRVQSSANKPTNTWEIQGVNSEGLSSEILKRNIKKAIMNRRAFQEGGNNAEKLNTFERLNVEQKVQ